MRLIHHASLWGNIYRHRYFKNGSRISEKEFNSDLADILTGTNEAVRKREGGTSWYRLTYTV